MRRTILISAFSLLISSFSSGQWYEATIPLPDSLAGLGMPNRIGYNETNNRVYVAGDWSEGVVVIDAAARERIGRFPTGCAVYDIAWSREHNRVYTADCLANTVTVADGQTNQVIASVSTEPLEHPYCLMLDESRDKLYVACDYDLVVVDLATNSILTTIPIPDSPSAMVLDTIRNRVYVAAWYKTLYFVDADADTVIRSMALPQLYYCDLLLLNPETDRLFCTGSCSRAMTVIDLDNDSVLTYIDTPYDPTAMIWNPNNDMIYVACRSPGLGIVDGRELRLCKWLNFVATKDIALDTLRNRLFAVANPPPDQFDEVVSHLIVVDCDSNVIDTMIEAGSSLWRTLKVPGQDDVWLTDAGMCQAIAFDCATLSELARLQIGTRVNVVAWDSIDNRLYAANVRCSTISVVDGASLKVVDTIKVSYSPFDLTWVPWNNKLYCTTVYSDLLIWVIDCNTNEPVASLPGHSGHNYMAYSPTSSKLYCAHQDGVTPDSSLVTVIDGITNQLVTTLMVGLGPYRLLWFPDSNWMFCSCLQSIAVIDCETDAVIASIEGLGSATEMVLDTSCSSLYCAAYTDNQVVVIDPVTFQVRKRLNVGLYPFPVALDARRNRVYCAASQGGSVAVIDCTTDSIVAQVEICTDGLLVDVLCNSLNNKVYCVDSWGNSVVVFDAATNQVIGTFQVRGAPAEMVWDPVANRVFIPNFYGGCVSVLRDAPPGIAEKDEGGRMKDGFRAATIVRGILVLPQPLSPNPQSLACLLDITGRKVADLQPGAHDIRHLSPGVYFLKAEGGRMKDETVMNAKIIIQR